MLQDVLWVEKYRPKKIDDIILPERLKKSLHEMVQQKMIPNLLLSGTAGIGKTTIAKALINELNADYIFINGSLNGGIDTLRNQISQFASTVSFTGERKYVIIDESDYLNCLEENEEILLLDDNGDLYSKKLNELSQEDEYKLVSFNMNTGKFEEDVGSIISDRTTDVFEVELEDGRKITVTKDHPFIVEELGVIKEQTISDGLSIGDYIITY